MSNKASRDGKVRHEALLEKVCHGHDRPGQVANDEAEVECFTIPGGASDTTDAVDLERRASSRNGSGRIGSAHRCPIAPAERAC
eukprot:12660552-Heterocapsa_arctica.AAC.1